MRQLLPQMWPVACLLVAVATCGCQNCQKCCCNGSRPNGCSCAAPTATMRGVAVGIGNPSVPAANTTVRHVATYPKLRTTAYASANPALSPVTNSPKGVASRPAASAADAWVQRPQTSTPSVPVSTAANEWVQATPPSTVEMKIAAPATRLTAAPAQGTKASDTTLPEGARFGHDAEYRWLVGTLDYSRIQDAWVLRYVSYEEEDRYGGCVTLVAPGRGISFKQGQTVRVEGGLIDPSSQQLRPAFEVKDIRPLGS